MTCFLHVNDGLNAVFDPETVNGWVIKEFGYLPKVGESFVYRDLSISISKIEERRVKEIIVERIEEQKCS